MEHPVHLYKKRDQKERELTSYETQVDACDQALIKRRALYKVKLENYQKWKEENKINGINF